MGHSVTLTNSVTLTPVLWTEHGELRWTLVAGEQAPGIPANDATLYNVAALAKPVTAESALRASAAGVAEHDAP